jgi:alpha-methylacyl-CoA racemase
MSERREAGIPPSSERGPSGPAVTAESGRSGPLAGVRVLELPNIGPVQFAGMLLADMGAEVLRVDRATDVATGSGVTGFVSPYSVIDRGRRSIGVDLKNERGAEVVLKLCEQADVLLEGFRPGVAERLGVGPDACRARNPKLVYARMTGWGQDGPLAADVGHDINYLSIAGVLWHIGPEGGAPVPPINLLADFGGGGSLVVMGILAALVERASSGEGQVVDAAMVDGSAQLMSIFFGLDAMGGWGPRGTNLLDGGAHFYNVYETADGEYVSIASYEPKFYANLLALIGPLGFDDLDPAGQMDHERWPALKARLAALIRTRTSAEWVEFFAGHEVCFAPVLSMSQARAHPHNVARNTFVDVGGAPQPAPAPRFSRTPSAVQGEPVAAGAHTDAALAQWGFAPADVTALRECGAIA